MQIDGFRAREKEGGDEANDVGARYRVCFLSSRFPHFRRRNSPSSSWENPHFQRALSRSRFHYCILPHEGVFHPVAPAAGHQEMAVMGQPVSTTSKASITTTATSSVSSKPSSDCSVQRSSRCTVLGVPDGVDTVSLTERRIKVSAK